MCCLPPPSHSSLISSPFSICAQLLAGVCVFASHFSPFSDPQSSLWSCTHSSTETMQEMLWRVGWALPSCSWGSTQDESGDEFMPHQTQKLITFLLDTCKIIDPRLLNITPIKWFSFEINHIYLSLFNSQLASVIQNFQVVYLHIYQFQLAAWKDPCPKIIKCAWSCLFKSQTWAYLSTKTTISSSRTQMIMQISVKC